MLRKFHKFILLVFILILFLLTAGARSRIKGESVSPDKQNALSVFLDTSFEDYIKENITFVDYVRDREQAQLHILMTSQGTGSGGVEYTMLFTGREEFAGINDTLRCIAREPDTDEEIRSKILSKMKVGLMRYISRTPQVDYISINYREKRKPRIVKDNWDHWEFSIDLGGGLSGEESSEAYDYSLGVGADRVTDNWKLNFFYSTDYSESKYDVGDRKVKYIRKTNSFDGLVVKSISDHWSIGAYAEAKESIYYNLDFSATISPAIEFNIFPYSQSTRRDFRFLYKIEYIFNRYDEETIYYVTEESLYHHEFSVDLEVKENWGTLRGGIIASSYLHDLDLNRLTFDYSSSFRVTEGISFVIGARYSAIHDQVSIPRRGASAEDILLKRQQLETTYNYDTYFRISYRFGSKYTNIVNPRF